MEMAMAVAAKKEADYTEDDLDILAEAIEILNNSYEELYDKVYVK